MDWWWPLLAAPFVGSLLGVLIARLPAGLPVVWARSRCDHCGAALWVLLALAWIDVETMLLPDALTLALFLTTSARSVS